jgi:hypothetical protein
MITKFTAVKALVGEGLTGGDNLDEYVYHNNQIPPSEEEVNAKLKELQAEYDSKKYQRDRKYPEITEQLDLIYWDKKNGTKKWEEAIDKVKADNPKPE